MQSSDITEKAIFIYICMVLIGLLAAQTGAVFIALEAKGVIHSNTERNK